MYPAHLVRVSDAERESVVARLSAATAEGRLTLEEFSDRAQHAYAAQTWVQLTNLVQDLPRPARSFQPPAPAVRPPPIAFQPPAAATTSGSVLPMLALVLGIISIPAAFCPPGGAIAAIIAIVVGVVALRTVPDDELSQRGRAFAGVLCGSVGFAMQLGLLAVFGLFGL